MQFEHSKTKSGMLVRMAMLAACTLIYSLADGQPGYVLHRAFAVQAAYLDSLKEIAHTDSSTMRNYLTDYGRLVANTRAQKDEPLADELQLLVYSIQSGKDARADLRAPLEKILERAREREDGILEANALMVLGKYWGVKKKAALSLDCYFSALQVYRRFSPEDYPWKKRYLFDLGTVCQQYGDIDSAKKIFTEARQIRQDSSIDATLLNSLGVLYRNLGNYDSAGLLFRIVYDRAVQKKERQWMGIAAGNMGICLYYEGKYDEALPLIKTDIDTSKLTHQLQSAINSMYFLADIYFKKHDNAAAERTVDSALVLCRGKSFWPRYHLAENLYSLKSKLMAARGDFREAYIYRDSAAVARDSVFARSNALNLSRSREKIWLLQHRLDIAAVQGHMKIEVLIRNCLVLLVLFLLLIGVLLVKWQRIARKKLELEKDSAERELLAAAEKLEDFTGRIREKTDLIEQFEVELGRYKTTERQESENATLLELQQSTILTDEQWDDFQRLFEKVHKGFFRRVKEKMPDLTFTEVRFLALSKLKLSPKEMASMLGISANSIRNYRLRLRRRLGLNEEASIEEIADAI